VNKEAFKIAYQFLEELNSKLQPKDIVAILWFMATANKLVYEQHFSKERYQQYVDEGVKFAFEIYGEWRCEKKSKGSF